MSAPDVAPLAVVVGGGGQDGYYLCELLRARGDRVVSVGRRSFAGPAGSPGRALDIRQRADVDRLLDEVQPAEIYYLAGVFGSSESAPEDLLRDFQRSSEVHVTGWLNFLDAARSRHPAARLFYASSSRVFGNPARSPQDEGTPLAPLCVYGITKSTGMQLGRLYRGLGVHCSSGILYNHESPRRPASFVSRKIVRAAVDIKLGAAMKLTVGNLAAKVDWGAAQDYVEAMTRILELPQPDDFVIASGTAHTVRQFAQVAFAALDLDWEAHVVEDRTLLKSAPPAGVLVGDSTRLREATGWQPRLGFADMVRDMVGAELRARQPTPA